MELMELRILQIAVRALKISTAEILSYLGEPLLRDQDVKVE
jgi:hypothetical protein